MLDQGLDCKTLGSKRDLLLASIQTIELRHFEQIIISFAGQEFVDLYGSPQLMTRIVEFNQLLRVAFENKYVLVITW